MAVIAREVEYDGDGDWGGEGGVTVTAEQPEHFSGFKKNKAACATSRDKNKRSVPLVVIPRAHTWSWWWLQTLDLHTQVPTGH